MHTLNVRLDKRVQNLTHFGSDSHSIANVERARLRFDAEERRAVTSQLWVLSLMTAAFVAGFLLICAMVALA